jgi:hypothetical protein
MQRLLRIQQARRAAQRMDYPNKNNVRHNLIHVDHLKFYPLYPQSPGVVQSNKVYLSHEALLICFMFALRQVNPNR